MRFRRLAGQSPEISAPIDVSGHHIQFAYCAVFTNYNLAMAGYKSNPLDDNGLGDRRVHTTDIAERTIHSLRVSRPTKKEIHSCENCYALGLMLSFYSDPIEKEQRGVTKIVLPLTASLCPLLPSKTDSASIRRVQIRI